MNILKISIPTGALLVSALMAGTAIANNDNAAANVEDVIINDAMAQENPLVTPKGGLAYEIASADGEENECEDEDKDEDEGEDEDGEDKDGEDKDTGETEDEDEDDDGDEYAACGGDNMTSQG